MGRLTIFALALVLCSVTSPYAQAQGQTLTKHRESCLSIVEEPPIVLDRNFGAIRPAYFNNCDFRIDILICGAELGCRGGVIKSNSRQGEYDSDYEARADDRVAVCLAGYYAVTPGRNRKLEIPKPGEQYACMTYGYDPDERADAEEGIVDDPGNWLNAQDLHDFSTPSTQIESVESCIEVVEDTQVARFAAVNRCNEPLVLNACLRSNPYQYDVGRVNPQDHMWVESANLIIQACPLGSMPEGAASSPPVRATSNYRCIPSFVGDLP